MSVVSVNVQNLRPEYQNLCEWSNNKNNVYIGCKGVVFIDMQRYPKNSSIWANPYKVTDKCTRSESILKYEQYIRKKNN